ncbi:MAG: hypothetical protein AAGI49_19510 [Bacteroidota bacterium]
MLLNAFITNSCLFFLLLSNVVIAQSTSPRYYKQLGLQLMADEQYEEAHAALLNYQQAFSKDRKVLLYLAICSYHIRAFDEMETYLNHYRQTINRRPPIFQLYQARLLQTNAKYEAAAKAYKTFLRLEKENLNQRKLAKQELRQCGIAIRLAHRVPSFELMEDTPDLNTSFDEILPIASPNYEEVFYFSSDRRSNYDIYSVEESTSPNLLEGPINTAADERLLGFGCDGQRLFFRRAATVFVDSFNNIALQAIDLPEYAEAQTAFFFCDSVLLFASKELKGYGGYDLFFIRKLRKGWTSPKNLGEQINSAYDERSPFLDVDGRTLYFSSNDPSKSIGGYDVFKSVFELEQAVWLSPENMGRRINSYADEFSFRLNRKGTRAYFTSDHWQGKGGQDIYAIRWDEQVERTDEVFFFDDLLDFQQKQLVAQLPPVSEDDFHYKIQLQIDTSAAIEIPSVLAHPIKMYDEQLSAYRYSFGHYQSFATALAWCEEVQQKDWVTARVVAYIDGKVIDVVQAKALLAAYEDLEGYLAYLEEEE